MPGATTKYGLGYSLGTDLASTIDDTMQDLANDLDAIIATDDQGLRSARPVSTPGSPGKKGRYYYATDNGILYRDAGTSWVEVGSVVGSLSVGDGNYGLSTIVNGLVVRGYLFTAFNVNGEERMRLSETTLTHAGFISTAADFLFDSFLYPCNGVGATQSTYYVYQTDTRIATNATAFASVSDEKLKDDIATLDGSLGKIQSLRGVSFNWKEDGSDAVGLVAQEVQNVFPEIVSAGRDGTLVMDHAGLVGPLVEAVKDLAARVEALEK